MRIGGIEIVRFSGKALIPYLSEIAQLRIEVFREFPYLYDGSEDYEREYLQVYTESERSVAVIALRDGEIIGVSTGLPLIEANEAFQKPFEDAGIDPAAVFYFGESVLKSVERGQGIGHEFFTQRECHAKDLGFWTTAFCAVERADDHPMKPPGYRPHDNFWKKRGYKKFDKLKTELEWKEIGKSQETSNRLIFWLKTTTSEAS